MMRKTFNTEVKVDIDRLYEILEHEDNSIYQKVIDYTLKGYK